MQHIHVCTYGQTPSYSVLPTVENTHAIMHHALDVSECVIEVVELRGSEVQ